jgi:hypothetical protein
VPIVAAVASAGASGAVTISQANAAKSAEPKAKKKGKKRKSGGGGGRRAPKLAPLDSVRMLPELWQRWISRDQSVSMDVDPRFCVKPSLIEDAGDGLFCAQPLCKGDKLALIGTPTISSKLTTAARRAYTGFVLETVFNVDLSACKVRFACAIFTYHRGSYNDVISFLLRLHHLYRLSCDVNQPALLKK